MKIISHRTPLFAALSFVCLGLATSISAASTTITFQQGANITINGASIGVNYTNAVDTYTDGTNVNGISPDILVIGGTKVGLLRFTGIFGNGASQIPVGAVINGASLSLTRTSGTGTVAFGILDPSQTWNASSTEGNFSGGNGIQYGTNATFIGPVAFFPATNNVTSSLATWAPNPALNNGWAFTSTTNSGFASSDAVTVSSRPMLTVTFTPITGYTNFIVPGLNLIANPLDHGSNTLGEILTHVQDGDRVYTYNGTFDEIDFIGGFGWFDQGIAGGGPTNGPSVPPGTGFFLYNSGAGYSQGFNGTPHLPALPVGLSCSNGFNLLGNQEIGQGNFRTITGLAEQEGDQVLVYIGTGQSAPQPISYISGDYVTYIYSGGAWQPSPPIINTGQGAFFARYCSNSCLSISANDIYILSRTPASADYDPPATSGCEGNLTTFCRPPAGTLFPLGRWPVHCTAISSAGYVASCDFYVTIAPSPDQPPSSSYTIQINPGLNLIANQFNDGGDTLLEVLPFVLDGSVLTKYDNTNSVWIQSTYNGSIGAWIPPFTLRPGEGAFLNSPSSLSLFMQGTLNTPTLPLSFTNSIYLVSRQTNAVGNFTNITGMAPTAGVHVFKWNGTGYDTFSFNGTSWFPSEPSNQVGEAFWIGTGIATPPPIPARPTITSQPGTQFSNLGSSVLLTASVTGDGPFFYQWRLNANVIPGATNSQYLVANLQPATCGNYDVQIYNSIGITNSFAATLGITNAPVLAFAATFAAAGALPSTVNGFGVTSNAGSAPEPGEPDAGFIPGGAPIWVTWTAPTDGIATFSTAGSGFDTLLAIYTGTNITSLTPVVSDDDSAGHLWSQASFNAVTGTTYDIQVDGFYGSAGNVILSWNEIATSAQLPVITTQPQSQTVAAGDSASFNFTVQSGQSNTFQWLLNGSPIPGSTRSILSISNVGMSDIGIYQAQITNVVGGLSVITFPAELQINSAGSGNPINSAARSEDKAFAALDETVRPNDPYDPAIITGFTGTQIFGMYGTSTDVNEPPHCGASCTYTKWQTYNATNNGIATVDNIGTTFGGVLAVYTGGSTNYGNMIPIACSAGHGIGTEVASFQVANMVKYYIMMGSTNVADSNGMVVLHMTTITPPLYTTLPVGQSTVIGGNISLNTLATGFPPPTYQWLQNGTNVMNATSTLLQLNNFQIGSNGDYTIIAKNSAGTNTFNFTPVFLNAPLRFTNTTQVGTYFFSQLIGKPNSNYIIQASSTANLTNNWVPIATNNASGGIINYIIPTNGAGLFYRAVLMTN